MCNKFQYEEIKVWVTIGHFTFSLIFQRVVVEVREETNGEEVKYKTKSKRKKQKKIGTKVKL